MTPLVVPFELIFYHAGCLAFRVLPIRAFTFCAQLCSINHYTQVFHLNAHELGVFVGN